jgi:hypothetical protein
MNITCNKILYIGAGLNIQYVQHFPDTKNFVFIDSLPRSKSETLNPKFNPENYKCNFINDLFIICNHYGFQIDSFTNLDKKYHKKIISKFWYYTSWIYKIPIDINPIRLVFFNKKTNQKISYYISTNILHNMNKILQHEINTCDGILVSEYYPENEILRYFVKPMIFFGYTNTSYQIDFSYPTKENDNIIYFLYNCICNTKYYFSDFYMVQSEDGLIVKCNDFNHFLTNVDNYNNNIRQLIDDDNTEQSDF